MPRSWPSAGLPWWLPVPSERTTTSEPAGSPAPPVLGRASGAALRRPRRLTARAVVPVLLAVIAGGFTFEALQDRAAMTSIVVAASLVPAGSPVNGNDTRLVKVHATDLALTKGLVPPSELAEGWVAAVAVQAGQPITLSELERPPSGPALGEMSVAVPMQQAAGGRISPGDLVDVIAAQGQRGILRGSELACACGCPHVCVEWRIERRHDGLFCRCRRWKTDPAEDCRCLRRTG